MKLFKTRRWIILSFSLFFLFISHLSSSAVYLTIKNETKSLNIQAQDIDVYKDSRHQKMQSMVLAPGDKETLSWTNAWLNWECNDGDTWYSNLTIQVVSKKTSAQGDTIIGPAPFGGGIVSLPSSSNIQVNLKRGEPYYGVVSGGGFKIIAKPVGTMKWWKDSSSASPFNETNCQYYEGFEITVSQAKD